jgi:hypothetical protein
MSIGVITSNSVISVLSKLLALRLDIACAKFPLESLDSACGINELLLARIERMAVGANFSVYLFSGRAGFKRVSATAANHYFFVFWMNTIFHFISPKVHKTIILAGNNRFARFFYHKKNKRPPH